MVVEPHGTVVDVKRAKSSALAAYLACNPQRHTRNHLVSLLWPEVNEARGLASLRPPLWELQRLLGGGPPAPEACLVPLPELISGILG
ncbi:MAG TPA: hypothetical protein VK458_12625 [Myxococcaceae bacterium]|nr:hypothetical protein [Myxococcaceae bacterium]